MLSESAWETLVAVLGTVGLDSAGRVTEERVGSDSSVETVRVEKVELASVPELVTGEVAMVSTSSGTVPVGRAELAPAPGLVAVEDMLSDSLWEALKVVWETIRPVSGGRVTADTAASGSREDTVRVGTADPASVSSRVAREAVVSTGTWELVEVAAVVPVVPIPAPVGCEVTTPAPTGWTVLPGRVELASAPLPVATEGALSDSLWATLAGPWGNNVLGSAGWVTRETAASDSCRDSVRVEKAVLASVPGLVMREVAPGGTPRGTVTAGMAELASAPGGVAVDDGLSGPPWGTSGVVLETEGLVFGEWTQGPVASGSCGEAGAVGTVGLAWAAGRVPREAAVSGSGGASVRVGKAVPVSALELLTCGIPTADTAGESAQGEMVELLCAPGRGTEETVVSGPRGDSVRAGTADLASVSKWLAQEAVVPR